MEDVHEAHRLISGAMHKAYIDPRTGRIDMDLITTGVSMSKREAYDELKKRVQSLIETSEKGIRFVEIFRKVNEVSRVTEEELEDVIETLAIGNGVTVKGRMRGEMILSKK